MPEAARELRAAAQRLRTLADPASDEYQKAWDTASKAFSTAGVHLNMHLAASVLMAELIPMRLALAAVLEKAAADIVDNPNVYAEGTRAEDWYAAELALARLVLEVK